MDTIKKDAYLLLVGSVVLLVRVVRWYEYTTPTMILFFVGAAVAVVGLLLAIWEKRTQKPFFYAYGRHWCGLYIDNSAFILGLSTGFFAVTIKFGIIALIIEIIIYTTVYSIIPPKFE